MQNSILKNLLVIEQALEQDLQDIRRMIQRHQQPELPLGEVPPRSQAIKAIAEDISNANQFRRAVAQLLASFGALYTQELIPRLIEHYATVGIRFPYKREYVRAFLSRERQKGRLDKDSLGRYRLPVDDAEAAEHIHNQKVAEEENEAIAEQEIEKDEETTLEE